ncbi:nitroreductase family protein [Anaerotalea alkaliphila]|uniref:Putative nitroreductase TM1586 domain-containing protein n=1 Tax=Anaerotalea alkaliphila TaxID=2662126 RepID=A0A7X5HTE5_9FIRM|nr:nitroreductase family protein [Anaerotalea alkaliphila]NDL66337.1 hypothetical protein [Anaerotalea alkaliphila]
MLWTDWEGAIRERKSVRSFQPEAVEEGKMEKLKNFLRQMRVPFEHQVECRLFRAEQGEGLYPGMDTPPDNVAFVTELDPVSVSKAGFVGELLLLYAQSLGISSCWHGTYRKKWEGAAPVCLSPLGTPAPERRGLLERVFKAVTVGGRKPLEELLVRKKGMTINQITNTVQFALHLARMAPSAYNGQPWRFDVSEDSRTVRLLLGSGGKSRKWKHQDLDLGICACHFWLGLTLRGVKPRVEVKEEDGRAAWTFSL